MANNLFVSYDLHAPDKNYDAVIKAIKELGSWAKVHYSYFYVKSDHTASEACNHVWKSMDKNDRVIVVDAKNNTAAWQNLPDDVSAFIKANWQSR
jgi:cytochrome c556